MQSMHTLGSSAPSPTSRSSRTSRTSSLCISVPEASFDALQGYQAQIIAHVLSSFFVQVRFNLFMLVIAVSAGSSEKLGKGFRQAAAIDPFHH